MKSASGDIDVGSMASDRLGATTASGDVTVRRAEDGEIEIKSASGKVVVGVLDGTATLLDCSSVAGQVRSELSPSAAPSEGDDRRLFVKARSVSGAITIQKSY
jgi:DUF4097 and DUF4098 domain-containing protein YvlB